MDEDSGVLHIDLILSCGLFTQFWTIYNLLPFNLEIKMILLMLVVSISIQVSSSCANSFALESFRTYKEAFLIDVFEILWEELLRAP